MPNITEKGENLKNPYSSKSGSLITINKWMIAD